MINTNGVPHGPAQIHELQKKKKEKYENKNAMTNETTQSTAENMMSIQQMWSDFKLNGMRCISFHNG